MKIIFATNNKGKLSEVREILKSKNIEIISLSDLDDVPEIIEDGSTYEENAFIKAQTIYNLFKMPVIADDSGLMVDQLNGEPGVYSARYAGENCTYADNNAKLLNELKIFKEPHKAKFVCCALFYDGKEKVVAEGILEGKIIKELKGSNGFGFDPVFVPKGYDLTLAEITNDEKNSISHRGRAFRRLKMLLIEKGVLN